jgi:hypothetical protein
MTQQSPRRLLDDPRIGVQLRADLANARAHGANYDPTEGLVALRSALDGAAPAVAWSDGLRSVATRWWGWTATGLATAGAVWFVQRETPVETAPREATPVTMLVAPVQAPLDVPAAEPSRRVDALLPERVAPSSARAEVASPTPRRMRARAAATREPERASPQLEPYFVEQETAPAREPERAPAIVPASATDRMTELEHLARVRHLLSTHPREALQAARDGQLRFAEGMFSEERAGLIVFALDRLGEANEARDEGRRFLRAHPSAPFAARIRGIVERIEGATP